MQLVEKSYDPAKISWFVWLLCKIFPYKELGWKEIREVFFRWTLLRIPFTGWKVCLHRLDAENWHEQCHDHPWDFYAIVLGPGYYERVDPKQKTTGSGIRCGDDLFWRRPGAILWRPAESKHNVITLAGRPNWSIVIMSQKKRPWGLLPCTQE